MRFLDKGKVVVIDGYVFNEVDKMPTINDIFTNSFGYTFKITDIINRYNKNCFSVVIDDEDCIDVYYEK